MIQPIEIKLDIEEIVPGFLVDEHYAIYQNVHFFLLKVKRSAGSIFIQDGPHVHLLKSQEPYEGIETIRKIMSILQGKSAWWFLTEILDLSEEIDFNLELIKEG